MLLASCQIIQIKRQLLNGDRGTRMLCEALPIWVLRLEFLILIKLIQEGGYVLRIAMQLKQSCTLNQQSDTSDCLNRVVWSLVRGRPRNKNFQCLSNWSTGDSSLI